MMYMFQQGIAKMKSNLFDIFHHRVKGKLLELYKQVASVMQAIHNGSRDPCNLYAIAQKCVHSEHINYWVVGLSTILLLCCRWKKDIYSFRMVVWLVTYYNFYNIKVHQVIQIHSPYLAP